MFKALLWDIDNTLLDFLLAEKNSLISAFKKLGIGECTNEMVKLYSSINVKHWEMLERGEIDKPDVYKRRFIEFLNTVGINDIDPLLVNETYELGICDTVAFVENAYDIVFSLKDDYRQYAVTNGRRDVQLKRLEDSNLKSIFDGIFISDTIGYEKPDREFFSVVLANIIPCKKEEILIIGDSLTSDMLGGNNAGIKCCWYNPEHKRNTGGIIIDYEISSLHEIYDILGKKI